LETGFWSNYSGMFQEKYRRVDQVQNAWQASRPTYMANQDQATACFWGGGEWALVLAGVGEGEFSLVWCVGCDEKGCSD
jgi:hypothetical protein